MYKALGSIPTLYKPDESEFKASVVYSELRDSRAILVRLFQYLTPKKQAGSGVKVHSWVHRV